MTYAAQDAEWRRIRDEKIAAWDAAGRPHGQAPTAYQVTLEQKKRCLARGERFMELDAILAELAHET